MNRYKKSIVCLSWLILAPTAAHLAFSSLGFNPTDDGWILAYSRDILLGRVPHRDIGSFHMAGSYFLWAPLVSVAGDYVFWIGRLMVWLEHAMIAWLWIIILARLFRITLHPVEMLALALVTCVFDIHTFPIMPWNTTDAMLFCSLGLALALRESPSSRLLGYGLVGTSYLFRQNFVVMAPLALLVLNDWRAPRYWLAAMAPGALYGAYLTLGGALGIALKQLTYQHDIQSLGWTAYLDEGHVIIPAFVLGVMIMAIRHQTLPWPLARGLQSVVAHGVLYAVILIDAAHLARADFVWDPSFFLFGMALGALAYFLVARRGAGRAATAAEGRGYRGGPYWRGGLLALALAWSVSLSIGYNTPAQAAGILILLLLLWVRGPDQAAGRFSVRSVAPVATVGLVALAAAYAFVLARENHIYRDRPAQELSYSLDRIFPGGKMLRTNRNTYEYLLDLKRTVARLHGKPYAVLPDCPGWWVRSSQPDWLPVPWPLATEVEPPSILSSVEAALSAHRGKAIILISRYSAAELAMGNFRDSLIGNPVTWYVHQTFRKIGTTRYFYLYD